MWDHSGSRILCSDDGKMKIVNMKTGQEDVIEVGKYAPYLCPAWSPDDRFIALLKIRDTFWYKIGLEWAHFDLVVVSSDTQKQFTVLRKLDFVDRVIWIK